MAINLRHLRLFAAVVDHGGFTKAAAQLGHQSAGHLEVAR